MTKENLMQMGHYSMTIYQMSNSKVDWFNYEQSKSIVTYFSSGN